MTTLIKAKLDATRRKHLSFATSAGAAMAGCAFLAALGVAMLLDWWVELPAWARAGMLAMNLAAVAYLVVRHMIGPVWTAPDDDEVALWVEAHAPQLSSRLITAVQLARPGALPAGSAVSLVRETIRQAHKLAESIDFTEVVRPDKLRRWSIAAGVVAVVALGSMVIGGRPVFALIGRALLVPGIEVPRRTRVDLLTKDSLIVPRGEPVTLRAKAVGAIPTEGSLNATFSAAGSSSTQRYRLSPDTGKPDEFSLTIDNVQSSFGYVVRLGDGHSKRALVEAVDRPTAIHVRCVQTYPPYTKLAEQARSTGDLTLLAGSRLAVHVIANKPVKRDLASGDAAPINRIHLIGSGGVARDVPLVPEANSADRTRLVTHDPENDSPAFALPAGLNGFSIHLTDEHGFTTKDPVVYRIDVVPDKPPTVRVTTPARKEDLVTRRALIDVGIDASDDYGIAKLSLTYKIVATFEESPPNATATRSDDSDGETTVTTIVEHHGRVPIALESDARAFRGSHALRVDKLLPPIVEGQTLEWWLEAEDANNLTGPGKSSSEHYTAKVVTDAEKRADLLSRLGNYLGQINELSESQREASDELRGALYDRPASPTTAPDRP